MLGSAACLPGLAWFVDFLFLYFVGESVGDLLGEVHVSILGPTKGIGGRIDVQVNSRDGRRSPLRVFI